MTILQGDAYLIPINLTRDGKAVTADDVSDMEIILGGISKLYPGEVEYRDGKFLFPLTQDESFDIEADRYDLLVRPKFTDDTVTGILKAGEVEIVETESRRVL